MALRNATSSRSIERTRLGMWRDVGRMPCSWTPFTTLSLSLSQLPSGRVPGGVGWRRRRRTAWTAGNGRSPRSMGGGGPPRDAGRRGGRGQRGRGEGRGKGRDAQRKEGTGSCHGDHARSTSVMPIASTHSTGDRCAH
eukprot:scaffold1214_cov311-Pavlova_lutheri.AAC.6